MSGSRRGLHPRTTLVDPWYSRRRPVPSPDAAIALRGGSGKLGFIGMLGASHAPFYAGRAPRDLAWPAGIRR